MPYAIIGFVVFLALAGWKVFDWGWDSGFATNEAEVFKAKNIELADLNQQNVALQDIIDAERMVNFELGASLTARYKQEMNRAKAKERRAVDDLTNALQLQLFNAENSGKDETYTKEGSFSSFISGLTGTEGSKLTPKTRYHLEQLSFYGDENAVLFGLCQAQAINDRK